MEHRGGLAEALINHRRRAAHAVTGASRTPHDQALKTNNPEDDARIQAARTPGAAKRAGQRVDISEDWDVVRIGIMDHGLKHKFIRGSWLAEQLTATGDARLVEGNNWGDTFWGVSRGEGENWPGKLLARHRSQMGWRP